jgi:uncharacterized protein YlzI (FlbEa/FlbD family)
MWILLTEDSQPFCVNTDSLNWFSKGDDETILCIDGEMYGCEEPFDEVVRLVKGVQA